MAAKTFLGCQSSSRSGQRRSLRWEAWGPTSPTKPAYKHTKRARQRGTGRITKIGNLRTSPRQKNSRTRLQRGNSRNRLRSKSSRTAREKENPRIRGWAPFVRWETWGPASPAEPAYKDTKSATERHRQDNKDRKSANFPMAKKLAHNFYRPHSPSQGSTQ